MGEFRWDDKVVLLTGGTGSFGQKFVELMLATYRPRAIRIFSRDELKQHEMQQRWGDEPSLRFFIGDVRDPERVHRAMDGVDIVVHAAALKQVPACEYNPFEAVKTNILGAQNLVNAAIDHEVGRVVALSSDKAVNPVNIYGATKLCMEKIFVHGNSYAGARRTRCSVVRYGNVVGSRGSVVPVFRQQAPTGVLTITDERMTRFWITLEQGAQFVARCVERAQGGEIFVPKIPSMRILDLARTMVPDCQLQVTGIRPGEKLHELLLSEDEARNALEFDDCFVVEPNFGWWGEGSLPGGKRLPDGFSYSSSNNPRWLTPAEMRAMIGSHA